MMQVNFIGSRIEEFFNHVSIIYMKITGKIVKRNVQNGCERDIYTLDDFLYNGPDGNLMDDIDLSSFSDISDIIRREKFDFSHISRSFPSLLSLLRSLFF